MARSEESYEQRRRRRAWWLYVARRVAGLSQSGVAKAVGLSVNSASTVGDWERGVTEPSLKQLGQLAALYGAPLTLFVEPPLTDEERFADLAHVAIDLEREDWEAEEAADQAAGGGPDDARRRRPA
jgi:transcriptional regulator with XRE-family HTH domain